MVNTSLSIGADGAQRGCHAPPLLGLLLFFLSYILTVGGVLVVDGNQSYGGSVL